MCWPVVSEPVQPAWFPLGPEGWLAGGPPVTFSASQEVFPEVTASGQPYLELEVFISPSLQEQLINHWDLGRGFLIKTIGKPLIVGQALS